ncbi:MAG: hypothetical protein JW969_04270 [Spirochaetales bacterium]|nr:hypothetical protein [Spirochaetales bacterium]
MKYKEFIFPILIVSLFFTGFVSVHSEQIYYIDEMIDEAAWEVIDVISPKKGAKTIVVSYFNMDEGSAFLNDYIIGNLTTAIANGINEESLPLKIVNRQYLDQIMKELSFQLSDLADQTSQLKVGKVIGANIMVTGSIMKPDITVDKGIAYKINLQFIEVETGVVIGGYQAVFWTEQAQIAQNKKESDIKANKPEKEYTIWDDGQDFSVTWAEPKNGVKVSVSTPATGKSHLVVDVSWKDWDAGFGLEWVKNETYKLTGESRLSFKLKKAKGQDCEIEIALINGEDDIEMTGPPLVEMNYFDPKNKEYQEISIPLNQFVVKKGVTVDYSKIDEMDFNFYGILHSKGSAQYLIDAITLIP